MGFSSLSSSTICVLELRGRQVELSVRHDKSADLWRWKLQFHNGLTLEQGVASTRIAAQVAVQVAFEHRLRRAGVHRWHFTGYRWNEIVG